MPAVAAFAANDGDAGKVIGTLTDQGLAFGARQAVTRTLLDTFDGRLHAAGLRLELHRSTGLELVLTGAGPVPVQVSITHAPRLAADLPSGAFRARLAPVLDVRALLPRVALSARQTSAVGRDRSGKAVASVLVLDQLTVDVGEAPLPRCSVEIEELAGYPKPAARLRDLLGGLGLERLDGDTLAAAILATGLDPAGFSGSPTIALDPRGPAIEGYAAVLAHLADGIDANWEGTVDDVDPEFLHDLRVAVRRTRSVLAQGKRVLPAAVLSRYRKGFERLGSVTGPARDLDVYVMEWDGYVAPLPPETVAALGIVLDHLKKQRRAAHVALAEALRSATSQDIMASWHAWLDDPRSGRAPGPDADRPLGAVVAQRITKAQRRLLRRGRTIGPDSPAEDLHELRKDAKKLRYLLECFGGILPTASRKAFVQRLKALQDNLGEHQDAEVHVTQLREISRRLHRRAAADTLLAMGQLTEHLEQRHLAAREEFAQRFGAYDTKRTHRALDEVLSELAP